MRTDMSLLRRRALADALTAEGFTISATTLATMATRGGGPPFRRFGRVPLYEWGEALEWARSRLGKKVHSTAEFDVKGQLQ
ncbi:DNA-binding protein [Nordella sp. HKS 07]|uniref:DNA-binding protein n=1 Tax=Nordella sp. HKS 07 TaxID=2712222 RepID=UPI0013E1C103|nr:DNA-binding protein [Nordella sp. HKS 07]QIG47938.1 DNA-binding protein [Nordella sp. HKS 07]